MKNNQSVYEEVKQVRLYRKRWQLFGAEKNFLEKHRDRLAAASMLDVGIGAGRTTFFFPPLVKSYTGIDYSAAMITAARQRFSSLKQDSLVVMDARSLEVWNAHSYDVILFSFNGIDCVDYADRSLVLSGFYRLLKPDGILVFSFHNARHLHRLYSFQWPTNPYRIPGEWRRTKKLVALNGPVSQYASEPVYHLFDGADNFQTRVCYLLPEKQLEDLKVLGFGSVTLYDLQTGILLPENELHRYDGPWIFVQALKSPDGNNPDTAC